MCSSLTSHLLKHLIILISGIFKKKVYIIIYNEGLYLMTVFFINNLELYRYIVLQYVLIPYKDLKTKMFSLYSKFSHTCTNKT